MASPPESSSHFDFDNVQIDAYYLAPTHMIPNSRYPLLHYRGLAPPSDPCIGSSFFKLVRENGWPASWWVRYADTQKSHYHSFAHEAMVVLSGTATIRFGVGDTTDDMQANTYGSGYESGGVELEVHAGDVLVIPAGVAHKTHKARPQQELKFLAPGGGRGIPNDFVDHIDDFKVDGFSQMGCYPADGGQWDFALGGEGSLFSANTWSLPAPLTDPIFGKTGRGTLQYWTGTPGPYIIGIEEDKVEEKRDYGAGKGVPEEVLETLQAAKDAYKRRRAAIAEASKAKL